MTPYQELAQAFAAPEPTRVYKEWVRVLTTYRTAHPEWTEKLPANSNISAKAA